MDTGIGFADALQRVFPTTVSSYLPFRGWICQETLCDGSPVTFDLRQCGSPTCPQHKIWVIHQRCRTLRSPTRRASWTVARETPGNRPA